MSDPDYLITTDINRFDFERIYFCLGSSYWAPGIPREIVEKSFRNSLPVGAFLNGEQVGFGRAVTDYATFAYLADFFVVPEHRGRGLAQRMVRAVMNHGDLQKTRRFLLVTKDAQKLYEKLGFKVVPNPSDFMTIHRPDVYLD